MTLREALGGDPRVHELVDQVLDREDALIMLLDERRAISYAQGFGLSPCQLELVALEMERAVRSMTTASDIGTTRRIQREAGEDISDPGNRNRTGERLGRLGRQYPPRPG